MADPNDEDLWRLDRPAKDEYDDLAKDRQGTLDKARELSAISIPSVMPPDGYRSGDNLPPPNQSVNSWLVNTLASKLMLVAMPPNKPCLKFNVLEHRLQQAVEDDPELWSEIELALSRREETHRTRLESTFIRSAYTWSSKLLLVAGNSLWQQTNLDHPVVHRMDSYVVKRNTKGEQLLVILKERIRFSDLSGPDKQLVRLVQSQKGISPSSANPRDEFVDIYTVQRLDVEGEEDSDKTWRYWQEFEGTMIPGTEVEAPFETPPMYASWLIPRYGENWGGSYLEEYEGDLYIVENHHGSINDGAEAAALLWLFVKPGAPTSKKTIEEARNGKLMTGVADDITAFRLEKTNDFAFVKDNLEGTIRRLAAAFLSYVSIQRDAERVTAEEWQRLAGELDQAMGGLYSTLSQSHQRYVIRRFVALHEEKDQSIPPLPEGIVSLAVVTGIDALGRTSELEALMTGARLLKEVVPPEVLAQEINFSDFIRRVFAALGVKPDGLLKSRKQVADESATAQNSAMQQTLLEKGTTPVAKAGADAIAQMVTNQMSPEPQQ